ncbi:FxSxx-COOH system tetratricopeptide repeat protein, partial [Frankia sp. CcWB2]
YDIVWWVSAEQPTFLQKQLGDLALQLGSQAEPAPGEGALALVNRLSARRRWLLILDNLPGPMEPASYRADGRGHVIITSRNPAFQDSAGRIEVGLFERAESIKLLRARDASLSVADADLLSETLGDLPLVLAQAGSWLAETGMSIEEYLGLLTTHTQLILSEGRALHYPQSFAASWRVAIEQLERENPAAVHLLRLAAFLGPDPLPLTFISKAVTATSEQPDDDRAGDADPIVFHRTVAHLRRYGIARVSGRAIQLHRLVQAVLRDQVEPIERPVLRERAWELLAATDPGNPDDPANWSYYADVLPHLLSADHIAVDSPGSRALVMNAVWYLAAHGNYKSVHRIAQQAYGDVMK